MFFKNKKKRFAELNEEQQLGASLITVTRPNDIVSETFRTIRTNIQFSMIDQEFKSLMFTSSGAWEGKSTVTANVASVIADQGLRVLLVDADLRKPTVQKTFDIKGTSGLTTLLTNRDQNIQEVIQYISEASVYVLPAGPKPPNPSELLGSNRMNQVIDELEDLFDLVIFDTPPILAVTDGQIIANRVDGVVFVIREGVATMDNVRKSKQLLEVVNANVIGAIYNGASNSSANSYYGYGYGYGNGYGQELNE